MHGYTLGLLHGEGHEVYANHNVYERRKSGGRTAFQTFTKNNIWKLTKQLRIFDSKSKNNYF
jgi:tRNA (guanine-N7-)-methyltransferase